MSLSVSTRTMPGQFTMKIRIPGWVRNQVVPCDLYTYSDGKRLSYTVKVNWRTGYRVN